MHVSLPDMVLKSGARNAALRRRCLLGEKIGAGLQMSVALECMLHCWQKSYVQYTMCSVEELFSTRDDSSASETSQAQQGVLLLVPLVLGIGKACP